MTKDFVKNNSINDIINSFAESLKYSGLSMEDLNCCMIFCVGYTDIIFMFKVKEFNCVSKALYSICKTSKNNVGAVSDFYTVTGFEKSFTLKKSISSFELKQKLNEELNNSLSKINHIYHRQRC